MPFLQQGGNMMQSAHVTRSVKAMPQTTRKTFFAVIAFAQCHLLIS